MGNYDLYGNSYKTRQEALNAESAQCAEIDARYTSYEIKKQGERQERAEHELYERINYLEQRIEQLEELTKSLRPI